ncbi:hypothetical protein, partial [Noviherbaspirillum malthae]|uniref:hypothetical protein n=1 Tax=Noviherbaspirillum malthae TaxID=1260987 RepID=UPI001E5BA0C4
NFGNQRSLALGRPPFEFFFHRHAHVISFRDYHLSRFSVGRYKPALEIVGTACCSPFGKPACMLLGGIGLDDERKGSREMCLN